VFRKRYPADGLHVAKLCRAHAKYIRYTSVISVETDRKQITAIGLTFLFPAV